MSKGLFVTVADLDTGDVQGRFVAPGDYVCIPFAPCRLEHTSVTTSASEGTTHVLTIRHHDPQPLDT